MGFKSLISTKQAFIGLFNKAVSFKLALENASEQIVDLRLEYN